MVKEPPYGLMFHHFRGSGHPAGQGAIDASEFASILDRHDSILDPEDWIAKAETDRLQPNETCITFDDALRCQMDVALPILRERGVRAFFFVYSSVFHGVMERLELYRYFRSVHFASIEAFYEAFLAAAAKSALGAKIEAALATFDPESYLAAFPFYTRSDRIFRYLRDKVLGEEPYLAIMDGMVAGWMKTQPGLARHLWMDNEDLKKLRDEGHEIGLHSWSHPTALGQLPEARQYEEYARNREHLAAILGVNPRSMSHPCNSYSAGTLTLMKEFGIRIGFCSNRGTVPGRSLYEMPREDHANILAAMRKEAA
jgi:peptidoglycan/xylan/chitin deacetylase (PgdA/CDA1 family)